MEISLNFNAKHHSSNEAVVVAAYTKKESEGKKTTWKLMNSHWPKEWKEAFNNIALSKNFEGKSGQTFIFDLPTGRRILAIGLGEKSKYNQEALRRATATTYTNALNKVSHLAISLDSFAIKGDLEKTVYTIGEALFMASYSFDKYKKQKNDCKLVKVTLDSQAKKSQEKKCLKAWENAKIVAGSINVARDFVNEPPNVLNSVSYAKMVEADVKKNLKRVKTKILGKAELKKEKMGMFLSVNAGSAHDPRLVHLTYTPAKVTKNTKHIALVGKGLTFDTGGYSLKPGASMVNMKFDMAGSATMYGVFRAAAMLGVNCKVSCFLGMTDNAVNEHATMPDSIVTARNGKTVEILNTDAEGRLVLGDVLSYACDQKPDSIIDAATLTGAVLVSLGHEICGLLGNSDKLAASLTKSASAVSEHIWRLPIVEEFRSDLKSNVADLRNIGTSRFGGTAKAAAFLENFVEEGIDWAHLDIAGVGDSQSHLPYCPKKGASGLMVRTVLHYLQNVK